VDVAQAARRRVRGRRRGNPPPQRPDGPTSDELARRLDATRERLRREIPPSEPD
jgi:hypothetical protein